MSARHAQSTASTDDYCYMNENQIDSDLICAICQQPFIKPMVGKQCDHTFCKVCIRDWHKQHSTCPTCRQTSEFEPLTTRIVLSQLDRLLVRCLQCNESNIQRGNFADHIRNRCSSTILKCEAADLKCPWTGNRQQRIQHSTICPLLQIQPVVQELRTDISALGQQLQIFMDEMRDQLDYLQQQFNARALVNNTSQKQTNINNLEKERFNEINNDLRYTWIKERCYPVIYCNFCRNNNQPIKCLVCLRPTARDHILAHDYSSNGSNVICRICFEKYGNQMRVFKKH